jgi:pimeloyl-ACP methyl ester carboxylesterase
VVLLGPTIDPAARTLEQQVWRLIQNSRRESPHLGWIMIRDYAAAGMRRIIGTIRMSLEDRIEDKLPFVRSPVLVVRGGLDPIVPQQWAEEVVRLLPRGRLVVIRGAAHTINYTEPDAFVAAVRPFLNL